MCAKKVSRLSPPPGSPKKGSAEWVSFLSLGGTGEKGCPPQGPQGTCIIPSPSRCPWLSLKEGICPGFSLSPLTRIPSTFPQGLPSPAASYPRSRKIAALAPSLPPAALWSQRPAPLNLPELEDDASGHKNNNDGDGDCDIELGVHT